MSYVEVKRLEGEAIIIVTLHGSPSPEQMRDAAVEIDSLIGEGETEVVRIDDFRYLDSAFSEAVVGMAEVRSDKPGHPNDPRLKNVMVSEKGSALANMMQQAAQQPQYGSLKIPMYFSMEEALEAVRNGEI